MCLPNADIRNQEKFTSENGTPQILFRFSENHWVSKDTMREQVQEVEIIGSGQFNTWGCATIRKC